MTKLINAATTYLTQYNEQLNAKQKAALVSGYDLAIVVLQKAGYLTSDQVTTLKTIAANYKQQTRLPSLFRGRRQRTRFCCTDGTRPAVSPRCEGSDLGGEMKAGRKREDR